MTNDQADRLIAAMFAQAMLSNEPTPSLKLFQKHFQECLEALKPPPLQPGKMKEAVQNMGFMSRATRP